VSPPVDVAPVGVANLPDAGLGRGWEGPAVVALTLLLLAFGLVTLYSASSVLALRQNLPDTYFVLRQAAGALAGLVVLAACASLPYRLWERAAWPLLWASVFLLVLIVLPGTEAIAPEIKGARRWLRIAGVTVQPSEFAKLAVVVYLAGYLVRREQEVRNQWQGFFKPMAVLFAATLLLLVEPDFGATVIVAATAFGMLFLAGVRLGHFLLVLLGALGAMLALVISEPYRMQRLTAYTDPWADPYNSGFQLTQSLIAFGRGEWLGVGLGNSVQKLFYLPEAHTDFVFAIWSEETGFIGASVLMLLFAALIGRIFWVGRRASSAGETFGAYLCYGIGLVLAGQAFINMGVSSGLLPTKGLTLPFVSFGGSSLIVCCAMLALVLRVARETAPGRRRGGRR